MEDVSFDIPVPAEAKESGTAALVYKELDEKFQVTKRLGRHSAEGWEGVCLAIAEYVAWVELNEVWDRMPQTTGNLEPEV